MGTGQVPSDAAPLDPVGQVQARVAELERTIQDFEDAAAQAERCMDEVARLEKAGAARDESSLQPLSRALSASEAASARVSAANQALDDALVWAEDLARASEASAADLAPLPVGTLICDERYRLLQLLSTRPRVHLYLARRLYNPPGTRVSAPPLVAIREIVLDGLPPHVRQRVVRAAFEEFAAPRLFGTPYLPGAGDHVYVEDGRHYLVMQPRPARNHGPAFAQPLAEILANQPQGNAWPDLATALRLATRLCQTVARLHRLGTFLGELTPEIVLAEPLGRSEWSPLLLAAWPPAFSFWPGLTNEEAPQLYAQTFPPVEQDAQGSAGDRPFAAPEIFAGHCDERSDVYALGALLYLLLTGSVPTPASERQQPAPAPTGKSPRKARRGRKKGSARPAEPQPGQISVLAPPRQLNTRISPLLEQILLRALDLDPRQRFASAQDLAEALESMHLKEDIPHASAPYTQAKVSRLRKLLEWLKNK